ncbi:MAG: D-Ala-D-Ala carboxypeptidase family metallohydrolase [Desulfobacterales bacterium]|nr:D-Ala-D-Ala carboxypeptidase family metallohydrolase [Desulfobacterales bacterium]
MVAYFAAGVVQDALIARYYLALTRGGRGTAAALAVLITVLTVGVYDGLITSRAPLFILLYGLGTGLGTYLGMGRRDDEANVNYTTIGASVAGENVSEHITRAEFECHHCHKLPPDLYTFHDMYQELFDVFEHLRRRWQEFPPGGGITVESGYRCEEHNTFVGGAPLSGHLFGVALDLRFPSKSEADLAQSILERDRGDIRMGRYIKDPGLVHIDVAYLIRPRATEKWSRGVRWLI